MFRSTILALVVALTTLVGCSDSSGPSDSVEPWSSLALPDSIAAWLPWRADAAVGRALIVAYTQDMHSRLIEVTEAGLVGIDPGWDDDVRIFDVVITRSGRAAVVGVTMSGSAFVSVERDGAWTTTSLVNGNGWLGAVIERAAGGLVAVGQGMNRAVHARGTLDGTWTLEAVGLPGAANDKALVSVVEVDGALYACGFDDGGEGTVEFPWRLMMRDRGDGFELMERPCIDCSRREFRTLATTASGGVLLAGAVQDFSAGAEDESVAFVSSWSTTNEEWFDVVLPEAGLLDRVNDIVVASDRSIVLVCGERGTARLVRQPPVGVAAIEWGLDGDGEILAAVETGDGSILATGWRDVDGERRGLILRRGGE